VLELTRLRWRAFLWRRLEALRESALARAGLGGFDLVAAILCLARAERYAALDHVCRVRRLARLRPLDALAARLERWLERGTCRDSLGRPRSARENRLVDDFRRSETCRRLFRGGIRSFDRLVRIGGELMLLKEPDPRTGELGVLIVKYTQGFGRLAALYDLPRVLEHYQVVLEPSWVGYQDPVFRLFFAHERTVVVEAQQQSDQKTIESLGANLVAVPLGAGHWVDGEHFHPLPGIQKDYVAVYVANWAPHKRHELALEALARIEDPGARIALVGYPWRSYTRARLEREVQRRGLASRVDFYERINRKEVNRVLNRSHATLLLSRKEGASKIFYESLAAGTPVVVVEDHDGVRPESVNDRTGVRASARELHAALLMMREEGHQLDPHGWWHEHASIDASTAVLERALCAAAVREGRPWVRGLYRKKNDPNLQYCDPGLAARLAPAYGELARLLRSDRELLRFDLSYQRPRP
jgi:glycosyltransferase involved in cell wall biosynthesis